MRKNSNEKSLPQRSSSYHDRLGMGALGFFFSILAKRRPVPKYMNVLVCIRYMYQLYVCEASCMYVQVPYCTLLHVVATRWTYVHTGIDNIVATLNTVLCTTAVQGTVTRYHYNRLL